MAEHRLLLILETATFGALAMGAFSGFILGAGAAAVLFQQLSCAGVPFAFVLAIGAAVAAAIGLQMLCGFVTGVLVTLGAAAIAGTDFD